MLDVLETKMSETIGRIILDLYSTWKKSVRQHIPEEGHQHFDQRLQTIAASLDKDPRDYEAALIAADRGHTVWSLASDTCEVEPYGSAAFDMMRYFGNLFREVGKEFVEDAGVPKQNEHGTLDPKVNYLVVSSGGVFLVSGLEGELKQTPSTSDVRKLSFLDDPVPFLPVGYKKKSFEVNSNTLLYGPVKDTNLEKLFE